MATEGPCPASGVDYAVEIGPSCFGAVSLPRPYCSLRYEFQPASVCRDRPGVLKQHGGSNKVRSASSDAYGACVCTTLTPCASSPGCLQMSLYLANNNNGGELDIQFSGKFLQAKDDLDVIAIFDGSCFRLEQLCGQIKAKCVLAAGAATLPVACMCMWSTSAAPSNGLTHLTAATLLPSCTQLCTLRHNTVRCTWTYS